MTAAVSLNAAPGRSEDDRTRIARGVLMLLEGLSRRQGGYLAALDFYQGELGDDAALQEVMERLRGRTPAVLVTVGGVTYQSKSTTKRRYMADYSVELAVASNHWQSMEARAEGGGDKFVADADPGINSILHDVRDGLAGRPLNVAGTRAMVPLSEDVVFQSKGLIIFQSRWRASMGFAQPRSSDPTPEPAESVEVSTTLHVEAEQ